MKDCPRCEAPLHDHEAICPRCGEQQVVIKSGFGSNLVDSKSTMSPVPAIIVIALIIGGLVLATQQSWIGQLITRGPVKQEPADSLTPPVARQMFEERVTANLASVNAKGTFQWKQGEQVADINSPQPVSLDIQTQLRDPKLQHALIVEPVKGLMDKGNITTVTLNDARAGATWTYTLEAAPVDPTTAGGDGP